MAVELKTYGDLKKVIKLISLKQKGEKIGSIALDTIMGLVPGLEVAKTAFDFFKAIISKPDEKKTKTWLDRLDVDDEMSAIVDDTVENGFMKTISQTIESKPDDMPLDPNFNMNAEMVDYLMKKYEGRYIAGIKESKVNKEFMSQIKKGIEVEMEHTDDPKIALKIALDHIKEDPKYYDKLVKAGLEECCSRSISLHETANRLLISEGLNYHLENKIDLNKSIYRPQSTKFLELFEEARALYDQGKLQLSEQDEWYFSNTDLGNWGEYNGVKVPLDFPMTVDFLLEVKAKAKKKQPELNKPKRGGSKKFYVYVRKPGGGIKKVSFGDTSGLSAKINNPEARRSFAARHKCSQAKDKTTPKYWSCRLPRYAKLLGLKSNFSGFW